MRRIAVLNQKGGVGKTTTTVNLGWALAKAGRRVLLVDLDPQAHLTMHVGIEPDGTTPGVYELLTDAAPLADVRRTVDTRVDVIGSHIDLAAAEIELASVVGREVILRDALLAAPDACDIVLMDCPPSLGILSLNALAAAHEVIVPLQPHFLGLQGLGKLLETVRLVATRINPELKVTGIVLCLYDAGTRLASEVCDDLTRFLESARDQPVPWAGARIFDTIIRRNIKLAECPSHGLDIFRYEPRSHGAEDYAKLAIELLGPGAAARPASTPPAGPVPMEPAASPRPPDRPDTAPVAPESPADAASDDTPGSP